MKETITIIITVISLIGLGFHYNYKTNVTSDNNTELIKNNYGLDTLTENINFDIDKPNEQIIIDDVVAISHNNQCDKILDETDKMSFNDAFKYYYSCKTENDIFSWNNKEFSLMLKVEGNDTDLVKTNDRSKDQSLVSR